MKHGWKIRHLVQWHPPQTAFFSWEFPGVALSTFDFCGFFQTYHWTMPAITGITNMRGFQVIAANRGTAGGSSCMDIRKNMPSDGGKTIWTMWFGDGDKNHLHQCIHMIFSQSIRPDLQLDSPFQHLGPREKWLMLPQVKSRGIPVKNSFGKKSRRSACFLPTINKTRDAYIARKKKHQWYSQKNHTGVWLWLPRKADCHAAMRVKRDIQGIYDDTYHSGNPYGEDSAIIRNPRVVLLDCLLDRDPRIPPFHALRHSPRIWYEWTYPIILHHQPSYRSDIYQL